MSVEVLLIIPINLIKSKHSICQTIEAVQNKLGSMTMNYTCCDNTDSQLEEISELQQSKEQLISECRAKEEDINKLNSEINQLKKKLIDRDERIESMERQMDERSVEFIMPASAKANEEKLKLLEKNIEKLKEDLERANSENNILKKHKDEYQEKVNFSCFQIET